MNVSRKWEFPPPISLTNGATIAPWLDNVAAPYGPLNKTKTVNTEEKEEAMTSMHDRDAWMSVHSFSILFNDDRRSDHCH